MSLNILILKRLKWNTSSFSQKYNHNFLRKQQTLKRNTLLFHHKFHSNTFPTRGNSTVFRCSKSTRLTSSTPGAVVLSVLVICSSNSSLLFGTNENKCLLEEHREEKNNIISISSDIKIKSNNKTMLKKIWQILKRWYRSLKQKSIILTRVTEISLLSIPLLSILAPLAYFEQRYYLPANNDTGMMQDLCWKYTISIIDYLGPGFIKLAQWASTRRDLFSPTICNKLSKLQCDTRIHHWKHTHDALVESFGSDYLDKGLLITSSSPIVGSGAVAQVYKGYLKHYGPVAIKVLHPHVGKQIENDLFLLKSIANLLQSYILSNEMKQCMDLPGVVENVAEVLTDQVDLKIEADNLLKFQKNFQYHHQDGIIVNFPSPVQDWVSSTVLVEDLITDSQPISSFLSSTSDRNVDEKLKKQLAPPLFHAFLKMLFLDNFFHCDLHPGNILVSSTNNKNNTTNHPNKNNYTTFTTTDPSSPQTTITFLDAGLVHQLTKQDFQNLKDLFLAVVLNDGATAGELMISRALAPNSTTKKQPTPNDVKEFGKGIQTIVSDFHNQKLQSGSTNLTLSSIQIGALLTRVLDLCRMYKVEMDPVMVNVVVSTIVLEGLGRSLDPDLDLMDFALPFLIEATTSS